MEKYIEPRLAEINDCAPEKEFVEAYDDLEVAA